MFNLIILTILNQFWFYQIMMILVAKLKGTGNLYDNFNKVPKGKNKGITFNPNFANVEEESTESKTN